MPAIRLGFLGMWHVHTDGMLRQLAAHPDEFHLVGGFDPDPEVIAQRQATWGAAFPQFRWHTSAADMLGEELDGVLIEGRITENLQWAQMAINSGRPVLLEKPAGIDLEAFRELLASAHRQSLHVQLAYLFRYMSAVEELLRRVNNGELGQIYEFRGRLPKDLAGYDEYVRDLSVYPGGIFFEMAGHLVDFLVTIMGPPRDVTPFLAHHHSSPGDFIDHGVAISHHAHGWGILEVPALEVAPHSRRIEVYGTEGACVIPHLGSGHLGNRQTQPLQVYRRGQADWETLDLPAAPLQIRDLREFAAVITHQKAPDYSFDHDLAVHEALLKASGMLAASSAAPSHRDTTAATRADLPMT